ncbi:hypothetical protein QZH41_014043 [Actinostola sp. cb2023]|nr:hypothetical protein QZH41_014043 [Actinostola sp. cb2023]
MVVLVAVVVVLLIVEEMVVLVAVVVVILVVEEMVVLVAVVVVGDGGGGIDCGAGNCGGSATGSRGDGGSGSDCDAGSCGGSATGSRGDGGAGSCGGSATGSRGDGAGSDCGAGSCGGSATGSRGDGGGSDCGAGSCGGSATGSVVAVIVVLVAVVVVPLVVEEMVVLVAVVVVPLVVEEMVVVAVIVMLVAVVVVLLVVEEMVAVAVMVVLVAVVVVLLVVEEMVVVVIVMLVAVVVVLLVVEEMVVVVVIVVLVAVVVVLLVVEEMVVVAVIIVVAVDMFCLCDYRFLNPLLTRGFKKSLQESDLEELISLDGLEIEETTHKLQNNWNSEISRYKQDRKKPSLFRALAKTIGRNYALMIMHPCYHYTIFFNTPYYYHRKMIGLLAKEGCITLIYDKILKLSPTSYSKMQNINISNLVASDVAKIEGAFFYLHYLFLAPIEVFVVLYLLWQQISYSSLVGIGLLFLLVPLQVNMSSHIMYLRRQVLETIDFRTKVIRDMIAGIRVVKMYANEDLMMKLIGGARATEIGWFRKLSKGKSLFTTLFFCSPALISFLTFMTYVLTGNQLTAAKVFTCVALFNSVRNVMTMMLPAAVASLSEMRVSLDRIQTVLMLEELCPVCNGLEAEPWVYNGTVRENVTFGKDYDEDHYNEVIRVCALERDLALFSDGDMTLVGERGVALSGGQRARIGLARAVYSDADIYLLDDPLSAVDVHVGKHLYQKCIREYLSNKARILVTHQFRYVKQSDYVIAISEGEIVARGKFEDIRDSGIDLVAMCPKKSLEEEEELNIIANTVKSLDLTHRRRHSNASTMSSHLHEVLHNQLQTSHHVTEILEENEGDGVAFQVPVYEEHDTAGGEKKHEGAVAMSTYVTYFKSLRNIGVAIFILFLFALAQILSMLADWWLSYWYELLGCLLICDTLSGTKLHICTPKRSNEEEAFQRTSTTPDRNMYLGVYGAFTAGLLIVTLARTLIFYTHCLFASCRLHTRMLKALLRAPAYFFEVNSIGRILNRFSKDMNYVDESLPSTLIDFFSTAFMTIGVIVLVGASTPISFAIVLPIFIVFIIERMFYIRTARDLKRLDGISRSPLFGHFSTTFLGLDTIRAFNAKESFFHQFHHYLEANTRSLFGYICVSSWLTFRLELLSAIFVSFVALISPALHSSLSAGSVGLILTYATKLSSVLAKSIKKSTEVENMMTAVERIEEYCEIEPEAPNETDVKPPKGWPDKGEIVITNLSYSYHKSRPPVLRDINLTIKPAEKIGIVGRSGSGKSSLLSCLFRMAEPTGTCEIDGIDIKKLGLRDLRNGITIIPQEPVVFGANLRRNLDPKNQKKDDADIWSVLEEVQLKSYVELLPNKLDTILASGGVQFSVGQRQLICLARAILYHTKILVIDEATANVDSKTSKIIWETINVRFKDCTVLIISHRLFPVIQNDRIMVLDAGRIRELDSPHRLLQNPNSYFSHVVKDTGPFEESKLREMAKTAYLEKHKAEDTTQRKQSDEEKKVVEERSASNENEEKENGLVKQENQHPNLTEIPQIRIESDTTCDTFF